MIARISAWYGGMTARERLLVLLAAIVAGAVVLVYGIVLPVGAAFDAAAQRHARTTERSARLLAGIAALSAPAPRAAAGSGPVDQTVAASAEAAGLVLQSNQPRGNDATSVVVSGARPAAALGWVAGLGTRGLAIDSLTITPAPDGSVSVSASVRRAGA